MHFFYVSFLFSFLVLYVLVVPSISIFFDCNSNSLHCPFFFLSLLAPFVSLHIFPVIHLSPLSFLLLLPYPSCFLEILFVFPLIHFCQHRHYFFHVRISFSFVSQVFHSLLHLIPYSTLSFNPIFCSLTISSPFFHFFCHPSLSLY